MRLPNRCRLPVRWVWPALSVALGCALPAPTPAGAGEPDATAPVYTVDVRGSEGGFRWQGRQTIEFTNPGSSRLTRIWIRLWANGPRGCRYPAARIAAVTGARVGPLRSNCTAVALRLAEPVAPGERGSVSFRLSLRVPKERARFGAGDRARKVALLSNPFPALAHLERGRWRLDRYFEGEAWTYPLTEWNVRLRAPRQIRIAAPGVKQPDGSRQLRRGRDYSFAAGRLRIRRARIHGVQMTFSNPRGAPTRQLKDVERMTRKQFPRLVRAFGRYGWPDLNVVVTKSAGMEHTGLIMTPANPRIVAHELAHLWWYALIGNDQAQTPWLDEGFASFGEHVAGEPEIPLCQLGFEPSLVTRDIESFRRGSGPYFTVYIGGACMLAQLREEMGPKRFTRALRGYAIDNRYGWSTAARFRAAMDAASPVPLDSIWRRYNVR